MRRYLALGAMVITGAVGLVGGQVATAAPTAATHTCSSGYTHAVLSYGHRCLRRGQFCSLSQQSRYRRLGYVCIGGRLR